MGRRRNRGRRNNRGRRPQNKYFAIISAGWQSGVKNTPLEEAIARAEKLLREGPYNSIITNDAVGGIHGHITCLWVCYRPNRPVKNIRAYITEIYARKQIKTKLSHLQMAASDEGRSI